MKALDSKLYPESHRKPLKELSRMTDLDFYFQNKHSSCSLENPLEQESPDLEQGAQCEGNWSNSGKK